MPSYQTHFNGGRIFLVKYSPREHRIQVFKPKNDDDNNYTVKLFDIKEYKKIFIGLDKDEDNVDLPKSFGVGNSILVHLKDNQYMFIGLRIFTFATPEHDKITHYHSDIGPNDFPYPVAVGNKYAYFMFEEYKYVAKSLFPTGTVWRKPINFYSEHIPQSKKKKFPKFKSIVGRIGWEIQ